MNKEIVFLLFAATLTACSGNLSTVAGVSTASLSSGSSGSQSSSSSSETGIEAFQTGLYAFTNTEGCAQCHASAVAPFFDSPDLQTAYAQAKTLVNFADPSASLFIIKSGNNHCGVAVCQSASSPATVTTLLTQWANAENAGTSAAATPAPSPTPTYMTATIAMPTSIPAITSSSAPVVINFELSTLTPSVSKLNNAIFQVEVQMDNATTYKIFNPRIGGNSASVTVGGIHIFIRPSTTSTGIGTEGSSPANVWNTLSGVLAAAFSLTSASPTAPISANTLATTENFVQMQSSADFITVGFDSLE